MDEFIRIGDKVICQSKLEENLAEIFRLRSQGLSQQEVANQLGLERSFISRLEGLGEVRKGGKLAVIGFPIKNIAELQELLNRYGVEFSILLTEESRWRFIKEKSGLQLFNDIMKIMQELHSYDKVILLGSVQRVKMLSALLGKETLSMKLGESPLSEDVYVDPGQLERLLQICQ